ncbi:hypothetical protein TWF481_007779 [Arthrobotrys musiformis]|uniref:Extracellular membrane protein CFEM domain-containing protein n=1 Tax=Arthrobotrys musiformis TaxID=47236 RepID=A0AAV9WCI3_9PEZI
MSFTLLAVTFLLVAATSAQSAPPIPCNVVLETFSDCGGSILSDSSPRADFEAFNKCFCLDPSYPVVAQECLNQLDPNDPFGRSTGSAIQQSEQFCATVAQLLANGGGGGGGASPTSISTPSGTSDPAASACLPLDSALIACSATAAPALTSANIASCLCGANVEDGLGACFNYLATAEPAIASGLSVLNGGYCDAYASGPETEPTIGPTQTQQTGGDGTSTGASAATSSGAASTLQPFAFALFSVFSIFAITL